MRMLAAALFATGVWLAVRGQLLLDAAAPYGYFYWAKGGERLLISGLLLAAALTLPGASPATGPLPRRPVRLALAVLLLLAIALRAYDLPRTPPGLFYDEASNMHEAMRIAERGEHFVYTPANNGHPALYLYQMAGLFKLCGVTVTAARLTSALSGALAVLLLFLLARRMFDERVALLAAALLAVSRWHLSFSRIVFSGIQTTVWPALAVLLFWMLLRPTLREAESAPPAEAPEASPGRARWLLLPAAAGVALGLCGYSYSAAQFTVGVVVGLLLALLVRAPRALARQRLPLALAVLAFLLTLAPLALYFHAQPGEFNRRAGQVWLLSGVPEEQRLPILTDNVRRTLLEFNFIGDDNPRHNLPGRRLLDAASAALLPAALFWGLWHATRPAYFACLLWLALLLLPGILSTEAPHALRTLGALPPLILLLAALLGRIGEFLRSFLPVRLAAAPAVAFGLTWAVIAVGESALYFGKQTRSPEAWEHFEAPWRLAAETLRRFPDHALHCRPSDSLPLRMLLWEDRLSIAPFRRPADYLAVDAEREHLFLHVLTGRGDDPAARVQHFFPAARLERLLDPFGQPCLVLALPTPADYRHARGLRARYRAADGALIERVEPAQALAPKATGDFPLPPPFQAEWQATLVLPESLTARFQLTADGSAELRLDGTPYLSGETRRLASGLHNLRLSYSSPEATAPADMAPTGPVALHLAWDGGQGGGFEPLPEHFLVAQPFPSRGLVQRFFDRPNGWGEPDAQDAVQQIDFEWIEVPGDSRHFSMEWSGTLHVPFSGVYAFTARSQDRARIEIDGQEVLNVAGQARQSATARLYLSSGPHRLLVAYSDETGYSFMQLYWQPPNGEMEILPVEYLSPSFR